MTLKFTPPKATGRYALFVDYGNDRGLFKTFDELGSAKLSWRHHASYDAAKILELVEGEWFTLFDIPAKTEYANLPWVKDVNQSWRAHYRTTKRAVPMTRDEYAEWRLAVERERVQSKLHKRLTEGFTNRIGD